MVERECPFGELQLAEYDRPRGLEPGRNGGGTVGDTRSEHRDAGGRRHALDIAEILDGERYAVQRPAHLLRLDLPIRLLGIGQRLFRHYQLIASERPIQAFDALEHQIGGGRRRSCASGDPLSEIDRSAECTLVRHVMLLCLARFCVLTMTSLHHGIAAAWLKRSHVASNVEMAHQLSSLFSPWPVKGAGIWCSRARRLPIFSRGPNCKPLHCSPRRTLSPFALPQHVPGGLSMH